MHTRTLLLLTAVLTPLPASADLWITNFSTAAGGLASGVWRNNTTSTDLTIPVTLTQTGAVFDEETNLDGAFPWQDAFGIDFFIPNYDGDYVSLEVLGGATSNVIIAFNAEIVNPVLNFTDIDIQTTLVFGNGAIPTKVGGPFNLLVAGNTAKPNGVSANPFDPTDLETNGSLQFTGTFTKLSFQIVNVGTNPEVHDDRTGFSVSTTTEPVAATPSGELTIWTSGSNLYLSWPNTSTFARIEYTDSLGSKTWTTLDSADTTTEVMWSLPISSLGSTRYFRGVR